MRQSTGFTLIELLIVVAIIAILAAIAVPNFLEAQTRAKVARVRGDMRTTATGIESYRVDTNYYPWGVIDNWNPEPNRQRANWGFVPESLTTPIAYLTSLFDDPFGVYYAIRTGPHPSDRNILQVEPNSTHARYRYSQLKTWPLSGISQANWEPGYKNFLWPGGINVGSSAPPSALLISPPPYVLCSPGPCRAEDVVPPYIMSFSDGHFGVGRYDTSNGTVSNGDVLRAGGMSGE